MRNDGLCGSCNLRERALRAARIIGNAMRSLEVNGVVVGSAKIQMEEPLLTPM